MDIQQESEKKNQNPQCNSPNNKVWIGTKVKFKYSMSDAFVLNYFTEER